MLCMELSKKELRNNEMSSILCEITVSIIKKTTVLPDSTKLEKDEKYPKFIF